MDPYYNFDRYANFMRYVNRIRKLYITSEVILKDSINKKYFKGRRMMRIIRIRSPGMV